MPTRSPASPAVGSRREARTNWPTYAAHPDAVIVAGATDIGLWVTKQRTPLATLIDIGQVAELKRINAPMTACGSAPAFAMSMRWRR
jgi:xanthine dehydrogenase iron-sulfur cluster and FAD-binding subunit A